MPDIKHCLDMLGLRDFKTDKTLVIRDSRLACIYYFQVLVILGWSLYHILTMQTYLVNVSPVGRPNMWASQLHASSLRWNDAGKCDSNCNWARGYIDAVDKMHEWYSSSGGRYAYCGNALYDFVFDSEWTYGPWRCVFQDAAEVSTKTEQSIFFSTAVVTSTTLSFVPTDNAAIDSSEDCEHTFAAAGKPCLTQAVYRWGSCQCSSKSSEFYVAAEHLSMEMDHAFVSQHSGLRQDASSTSSMLPTTVIRLADCTSSLRGGPCDLMVIPKGQKVKVTVQQFLEWLNIDIDGDTCSQKGGLSLNMVNGTCPKARVTGLQIDFDIQYYNFNQDEGTTPGDDGDEPYCVILLSAVLTWTSLGNSVSKNNEPAWSAHPAIAQGLETRNSYKYGVRITLRNISGKLGRFNLNALLAAIVTVSVLLGIASFTTRMVARHGLGIHSECYDNVIQEKLNFKKELARFVCQAFAAKQTFLAIDACGDGTVNRRELQDMLNLLLEKDMDQLAIRKLSRAVFDVMDEPKAPVQQQPRLWCCRRHGYTGSQEKIQKDPSSGLGTLDASEFINMATEDRLSLQSLIDIINGFMKDSPDSDDPPLTDALSKLNHARSEPVTIWEVLSQQTKLAKTDSRAVLPSAREHADAGLPGQVQDGDSDVESV